MSYSPPYETRFNTRTKARVEQNRIASGLV